MLVEETCSSMGPSCRNRLLVHYMLCQCFGSKRQSKTASFCSGSSMTMYLSTKEAMAIASGEHTGSCKGQGLKTKAYHGYTQDEEGSLVMLRCECCDLTCGLCKEWALRYLRTSLNLSQRPEVKAPPTEPYYVHRILAAFF